MHRGRRNSGKAARMNERGVTLAIVALTLFLSLGMGAVAIDYGMVKSAEAEAQRAADAGALAGASVFLELAKTDPYVVPQARARAIDLATKNEIHRAAVVESEVDPQVDPAKEEVTVTVTRDGIQTWFASILGIPSVGVTAQATAHAAPAGNTPCVKPFALPDLWNEQQRSPTKANGQKLTGDTDSDRNWDSDELWQFDPAGNPDGSPADTYAPYDPDAEGGTIVQTGYGSTFRDPAGCTGTSCSRDRGRLLTIAAQSPKENLGPGFFYLLRLQDSQGGKDIKTNIEQCSPGVFSTDSTYDIEPGETKGPVKQGITTLMESDPGAHWDPTAGGGTGAVVGWNDGLYGADWRGSPRVIKVGLFDPHQIGTISVGGKVECGGNCELQFSNIALLFLEGLNGDVVSARFLYYVSGSGDPGEDGAGGSLVKKLVLIK
jgi:hypothetical protein